MSDKNKISRIVAEVPRTWEPPPDTSEAESLLEVGMLCVLARTLTPAQAVKTIKALRGAYNDWNELRISQVQEFRKQVQSKSEPVQTAAARDVRDYLQEVFQKCHGFDLEFLREDPNEASKFVSQLTFLGASAGHYLLWKATGGDVPVSAGVIRVLDRAGVMKRTTSVRKAHAVLEPLVPPEERAEFAVRVGLVVERWCDAKKPVCWECPLVVRLCPFGARVLKDWKAQQVRLEAARKKEEQRRRREEERARKKAEAEAKKRARELARRQAEIQRKRDAEEARKKKEEARKKAAEERAAAKKAREAARKKAEAKKKAAAKKKTSATRRKTSSARKTTKKTKPTTKRTTTKKRKRTSSKKADKKKSTTRKKTPARKTTKSGKRKTTKKGTRATTRRR